MSNPGKTLEELQQENEILRTRLEETEAALEAICSGSVDALVVNSSEGQQVFILQDAEHPYRIMVETMNEGAATILEDGIILYANLRLATMLVEPLETLIGSSILGYIPAEDHILFKRLVEQGFQNGSRAEMRFRSRGRSALPVLISFSPTRVEGAQALCLVATDLTEQKRSDEILAAERLARSILDQAAEAILVCDVNGKIIRANQAAVKICPQNPLFQPFESALPLSFHSSGGETRPFSITDVLRGERFHGVEAELLPSQGQKRSFLLSAAPLTKGQEEVIGCTVTLTDLTEHKLAEEALRQSEEKFSRAFQSSPVALAITRLADGRFIDVNESHYQVSGYTREEIIGCTGMELGLYTDPDRRAELIKRVQEQGSIRNFEMRTTTKSGKVLTVLVSMEPIEIDGEPCILATGIDITERKRAEAALKDYARKLERSNKDLQEFAFVVSHDLQEPLRKIESFSSQIGNTSNFDDTEREYLRRMREAAKRMRKMIDDLLELSRVTTHSNPYTRIDLNEVAKAVLEDLEPRLRRSRGQVVIHPLPVIEADPIQMHQLLQNLIGNAVKYHRPDHPPFVQVRSHEGTTGQVEISVEDNGIGFDMSSVDQIFQPFRRLHSRSEYEGTGIGLAICKKIVERHGGSISAQSIVGEGSTFLVVLPRNQP